MFGRPLCDNAYGYDAASRLASVSDGTNTASYGYLANSSLAGALTLQRGGSTRLTTVRGYDNLNRLTNILNNAALTVSSGYGYNAANQRTNQWREDGTYWVYQYDALGQVTSGKKYWADGTPVAGQQFTYNFDTIGNRVSTAAGGDQNGLNLRAASYTNNSLNEITGRGVPGYVEVQGSASSNATVTVNGVAAYQKTNYYRAELTVNNLSSPVYPAVTNQGALGTNSVFINGHALVVQTPESFGYDADGNLTHDGKWSYTWDGENRLIALQSLATIPDAAKRRLQYMYDEAGRRIFAQLLEWNTNTLSYAVVTEQRYWYDGWNIIGRSDLATTLVQNFVWGSDLSGSLQGAGGVGGLLMVDDSKGASDFYAYDGNGNVLGLVNANDGTLAAQYDYGPFGEVLHLTGPSARANPFRFSTKYQDDESDLLYYGYRYYNASTGRWLSRDPLEEQGGNNLYNMVGNDPVDSFDILGMRMPGHHLIPEAVLGRICPKMGHDIWESFLDVAGAVIPTPLDDHNRTAHGEYNKRVEQLIRDYMKSKKIKCGCLSGKKAEKFAGNILNAVKNSNDPYIRGFNGVVGQGTEAVAAWRDREGAAILADEASVLSATAVKASGVVRYAKLGGKVVKVVLVGQFIYLASQNGLQAATDQTVRDLIFADEFETGGKWLVDTTEDFLQPLTQEECCKRNGLDGLLDDDN